MKNAFLSLACAMVASGTALLILTPYSCPGQKICSEAVVYFDSGKSDLKPRARHVLDSLLTTWSATEILLELEGHTDSVMGADYNLQLSQARVAAVEGYIRKSGKQDIEIRSFARSEGQPAADNGNPQGKATNRRVTLQYVGLKGGNLTVTCANGTEVVLPASALGSCSVCNTHFSMNYYATDREIRRGGWGMQTADGRTLTTGGMVDLQTDCPDPQAQRKPFPACFTFPIQTSDPGFTAWMTNDRGRWVSVPQFEIASGKVKICTPYIMGRGMNYDKPADGWTDMGFTVKDSSGLRILRHSLVYPNPRGRKTILFERDSIYATDSVGKAMYKSLGCDANNGLWLCKREAWTLDTVKGYPVIHLATVEHYRPIRFSDTLQVVKVKRKYRIDQVAYVIKDADTTFAFQRIKKNKFQAPILLFDHMLSFQSAKGRKYTLNPKAIRRKYKPRPGWMLGKIRKF